MCLVCQRKAGGDTGGIWLLVESGWDIYIYDLYVQAFHMCLFCLLGDSAKLVC